MGLDESYEEIVRMAKDGIVIIQDGVIAMVNPALQRMLGYEEEELVGRPVEDILFPTAIHLFEEGQSGLDWTNRNGTSYCAALESSDGRIVNVEFSASHFVLSGRPAVLGIVRDITKEVELEARVTESETKYRRLFDSSPIAYFTLSPRGNVLDVNNAAVNLLGYREDQILRRNLASFVPDESRTNIVQQVTSEVAQGKSLESFEMQLQRKDGRNVWVSVNANLVERGDGSDAIALMALDIDRRKLAEAREHEERARANLYLEVMTHDLNNINQSLLFSLGLLEANPEMPPQFKQHFRDSAWNVRRAARMIANLRTLMRLSTSPPPPQEIDLFGFLQSATAAAQEDFPWKTLEMTTNIEPGKFLIAGHEHIHDVFFNILHNSLTFDEADTVRVEVKAEVLDDLKSVRIEFTDHGPGIPDEAKEFIFRRTGCPDEQIVGRGLGLTLVEQIVRGLGGRIRAENAVEGDHTKGTRFIVVLPRWIEPAELPCGRNTCITYYKSVHCVFCEQVLDSLTGVLTELGIPSTVLEVIDVDDPRLEINKAELPMLPYIKICNEEFTGLVSEDSIRASVLRLAMQSCFPDFL
ncbi:MAG: hypothetical protein DRP09_05675 [Candidatus Thorarchaeota archaeon]|nr:MAG: hypothetical protein DRP09_05675 [Candidatus Thorarchaeota archaeon]